MTKLKVIFIGVLGIIFLSTAAPAQTCPPFSYTLANGTLADATQVMADFNGLLTCANSSLAPLNNPHFTGFVGIGTTGPAYQLDMGNGTGTEYIRINGGNSGTAAGASLLFANGGYALDMIGDYSSIFGGAFNPALVLYTSGYSLLVPYGYVGIGTTGPAYQLDLGGGTGAEYLRINGGNTGTGAGSGIVFADGGSVTSEIGGYSVIYGGAFNPALTLYTTGSNVVIPNGYVGMGNTSPSFPVDVGAGTGLELLRINGGNSGSSAGSGIYLTNAGAVNTAIGNYSTIYGGAYNPALTLYTSGANVLIPNGKVGIGTTSPAGILDVSQNVNGVSYIGLTNASSGASASSNVKTLNDVSNQAEMGILSSGATPVGSIAAGDSYFFSTSTGLNIVAYNASAVIKLSTGGTAEKMRIDSTGKVGIGTTSPASLLHVGSTAASGVVVEFQNSSGACTHNPGSSSETVSCSSDARFKSGIQDTGDALGWLNDLRVREFIWNATGEQRTGVIAQEVKEKHPEMVHTDTKGFYTVDEPNPWKIIKAMQELKAENDNLHIAHDNEERNVASLTKAVHEQQAEISQLKAVNESYAAKLGQIEAVNHNYGAELKAMEQRISALQHKSDARETEVRISDITGPYQTH